jgi:chitinase
VTCTNVISQPWSTFSDFSTQIKEITRGIDYINVFYYARSGGGKFEMKSMQKISSVEDVRGSDF